MTPGDEVAVLRAEVAALRRQGRVLLALVVLALVGALAIAWGRRPAFRPMPEVGDGVSVQAVSVQAQEYLLVDPDGNLRGKWYCPPAGPFLTILDGHGRPIIELRESKDDGGGVLKLNDGTGRAVFVKP